VRGGAPDDGVQRRVLALSIYHVAEQLPNATAARFSAWWRRRAAVGR